jgi:hypothetical protein
MRGEKFLLFEDISRIHEISGISSVSGRHLVVVDIQPEYEDFIPFMGSFINFLNENYDSLSDLTFLYNGYDTLGMVSESEYKSWLFEYGLSEDVINGSKFYDKGYAFFRYCIDEGIDEGDIVELVRYMIEKGVNDSRDLDEEFWDEFIERFGIENIRELLEFSGDCISIPDLMDELRNYDNIVLCGGGIKECLKEVEIALSSLGKSFSVLTKYVY